MKKEDLEIYLKPAQFIDSDHPAVIEYARKVSSSAPDLRQKAVALYDAIRDGWRYDPYRIDLRPEAMKASALLHRNYGYCIEKACLLAACARVVGIPSRLGFANVKNHIGTERLEAMLKTNVLVFHGYAELYLAEKWVKATPAFNRELCDRLRVPTLPFDGANDSLFQQYTPDGSQFMEYLHDYGQFADIPRELFIRELRKHYPHVFKNQTMETLFMKGDVEVDE